MRFEQLYLERTDKTELQNCAWQDFAPRSVALDMVNKEQIGLESVVDLVFADPFYALQYQPTVTEQTHLRKLFDQISKDNTVLLIFGCPEMLYKFWFPIFQRGVASSKIEYKVHSSLFHLIRSQKRDNFTRNFGTWHSMCENALTVVRQPAASLKSNKKTKKADPEPRTPIWRYTPEFEDKYG